MALFRRTKSPADAAPGDGAPRSRSGSTALGSTGAGKGRPTPKRQRAAPPLPPPTNRKEAYSRLREKSREQRTKARVGMAEGDDRYILPRDQGPARRLVRNIVDARRNAGSYVFGVAILVVLVTAAPTVPPALRLAGSYVWLFIIVVIFADSYLLSRRIRRILTERMPAETSLRGHSFYGIMRAATFRRMRSPRPQVKLGSPV